MRFERMASRLGIECSIQLSYEDLAMQCVRECFKRRRFYLDFLHKSINFSFF